MPPPDLSDRIQAIHREIKRYGSQKAFCERIGVSESRLSRALQPALASDRRLAPIERAIAETQSESGIQNELSGDPVGYTRVPEVVLEPSAGPGTDEEVEVEEVQGDTLLPDTFIRREYGVSPERLRTIRVRGSSMEPTIRPGQRLLVALVPPAQALQDGLVYVFAGPGGVQIKRLFLEPGHVRVWSDNPDAPRFAVALPTFESEYRIVAVALEASHKL